MGGSTVRRRILVLAVLALAPLHAAQSADDFRLAEWPAIAPRPAFYLTDVDGRPRGPADFTGSVALVFFGFTQCPDICPTELVRLAQVMHGLGPDAAHVKVVFITLDPARDKPARLKAYLRAFDPDFVGLTGSSADINAAAASFSVQFAKVAVGADYTIDHSTGIYVLDRAGSLRLVGTPQTRIDDWLHDLRLLLRD
jgi:protein SCO1/2